MQTFNEQIRELLGFALPVPDNRSILLSLAAAALFSLLLWLTYRFANSAASYRPRFAVTLIALALLSTVLMNLIQSNLALSLGMLGSLSLVRFRTNISDPRDIGFLVWSMAIGLASATGCWLIGLAGSLLISLVLLLTRRSSGAQEMMLVVRGSKTDLDALHSLIEMDCRRCSVKAKNILADSFELVYDVSIAQSAGNEMIRRLFGLNGVDSVNLLAAHQAV